MNKHNEILTKMHPFCFYRPKDLKVSVSGGIYPILKSLVNGRVISKISDGKRNLYITNQQRLF